MRKTRRVYLIIYFVSVMAPAIPLVAPNAGVASNIDMLSESYHIQTQWSESVQHGAVVPVDSQGQPIDGSYTGGYDLSSQGLPISNSTTGHFGTVSASNSVDLFSVSNAASAAPYIHPQSPGYQIINSVTASAEGEWRFRPLSDSLALDLSYSYRDNYLQTGSGVAITLMDTTSSANLLNIFQNADLPPAHQIYNFTVDPTREYELVMSAELVRLHDADHGWQSITADISVPEPSTVILLGCGVIGLVAIRRRFKQ
jgi:PEP-CTERM motif